MPPAMRPSAARGSPCPPVAMISTSLARQAHRFVEADRRREIAADSRSPGRRLRMRSSERPAMHTLRPVSTRDPADRLEPRGVGREGGDEHPPLRLVDLAREARRGRSLPSPTAGPGRRWSNRTPARARRDRRFRSARPVLGASPITGVSSIFQSPVWKMLPNGVSMSRPLPSGIECDSATKLTLNGPSSTRSAALDDVELDLRRSAPPPRACRRSARR